MPHMHLPLQSGSDAILRRMARRCKTSEFASLVEQARASVSGFNVTTDIIVGFPGETESLWQETVDFVEAIGFGHIHVFSFSPREGTKAASMDVQVDNNTKKQRSAQLRSIAERQRRESIERQIGTTARVLWEGQSINKPDTQVFGYTENYTRVCMHANQAPKAGGIAACQLESIEPRGQYAIADLL